jgi:hypothetical protein
VEEDRVNQAKLVEVVQQEKEASAAVKQVEIGEPRRFVFVCITKSLVTIGESRRFRFVCRTKSRVEIGGPRRFVRDPSTNRWLCSFVADVVVLLCLLLLLSELVHEVESHKRTAAEQREQIAKLKQDLQAIKVGIDGWMPHLSV